MAPPPPAPAPLVPGRVVVALLAGGACGKRVGLFPRAPGYDCLEEVPPIISKLMGF